LVFSDDPLLTVDLALDVVLKHVSRFGESANDFKQCPSSAFIFLTPVRQKPNRLADRKSVDCHRVLSAQCSMPPLISAQLATEIINPSRTSLRRADVVADLD